MAVTMLRARRPFSRDPRRPHTRNFWREAGLYLVGGVGSTLAQAALFLLLREVVGSFPANLLAVATTTILSTEFHRRVTFAGASSAASRRWVQNGLTFSFYASYNSLVLLMLHAVVSGPSPVLESATLTAFALVGGISRFLLMRWWVFHQQQTHPRTQRPVTAATREGE